MNRAPAWAVAVLGVIAIVATLASLLTLSGIDLNATLAFLPITVRSPIRPAVIALVADLGLLAFCRRSRIGRSLGFVILATLGVVALALVARRGPRTWPFADGALIELYTIYASRGQQLLGAYSQFGWHHPGPALFYILAPFYLLGGQTVHALNAGALAINLSCLLLIVWVVVRRRDASPALAPALFVLLFLFVARVPSLLTSAWNPHVPVVPFVALLVVAAAAATGQVQLLPVGVALASFVAQAHVGFVPVAAGLLLASLVSAFLLARLRGDQMRPVMRWTNISLYVLAAMWLLPIAEQIANTPGNIERLASYFLLDQRPGQPVWTAWATASEAFTLPFRAGFQVPQGWQFARASNPAPLVLGTLLIASLAAVALRPFKAAGRFERALASLCLFACLLGFWSVLRINEAVADHAVFWLSTLGLVGVAVVSSVLIAAAFSKHESTRTRNPGYSFRRFLFSWQPAAALLVAGSTILGVRQLLAAERPSNAREENAVTVQVLTDDIVKTMHQMGIYRPQIRPGDRWDIAAGVVLQMMKDRMTFAVDPGTVDFYGRPLAPTGDEDAVFSIGGPSVHETLATRPDNILAARYHSVFVDAVRVTPRPR